MYEEARSIAAKFAALTNPVARRGIWKQLTMLRAEMRARRFGLVVGQRIVVPDRHGEWRILSVAIMHDGEVYATAEDGDETNGTWAMLMLRRGINRIYLGATRPKFLHTNGKEIPPFDLRPIIDRDREREATFIYCRVDLIDGGYYVSTSRLIDNVREERRLFGPRNRLLAIAWAEEYEAQATKFFADKERVARVEARKKENLT